MNTLLTNIYEDHSNPSGLAGINKLYKEVRKLYPEIKRSDVISFLNKQRTYTLHKETKKKFPRRKILAPKPRVILSCDLADLSELQKYNKGVRYVLFCIDVFSRYLQIALLKNKTGSSSKNALQLILEKDQSKGYSRLFTDLGGEFYNKHVADYLNRRNIKLYSNFSREVKAALAERVIRSVKSKIYKYLTLNNTLKYIDVLPDIATFQSRYE